VFFPVKAPHCALYTFRCDLSFGFRSFLFSSLVPLAGVFPLFNYLVCYYGTNRMSCSLLKNYMWLSRLVFLVDIIPRDAALEIQWFSPHMVVADTTTVAINLMGHSTSESGVG